MASAIGVALTDLTSGHQPISSVTIVQLETALVKLSPTANTERPALSWKNIKAAIRGRQRSEMTTSEFVSIHAEMLHLINELGQSLAESLGLDSVVLATVSYLLRVLVHMNVISSVARASNHGNSGSPIFNSLGLEYFTPESLPVDRLTPEFVARAEAIHQLFRAWRGSQSSSKLSKDLLHEMAWMHVNSHHGVVSQLSSELQDTDTISHPGTFRNGHNNRPYVTTQGKLGM